MAEDDRPVAVDEVREHPAPAGPVGGHRGRVLVILGDPERSRALAGELVACGWKTAHALNAAVGEPGPDVLVTDSSGTGLRPSLPGVPALFLVPQEAAAKFVWGAAMPEDDYLSGQYTAEDVAVRLCWMARRLPSRQDSAAGRVGEIPGAGTGPRRDELVVGDLALVPGSLLARRGKHSIALPRRQAALLAVLMARAGSVVGKDEILGQVWGESLTSANWNKVEICASSLRRRINAAGPPMIRTVRGAGYMIEAEATG